jgi:hypothetical protein
MEEKYESKKEKQSLLSAAFSELLRRVGCVDADLPSFPRDSGARGGGASLLHGAAGGDGAADPAVHLPRDLRLHVERGRGLPRVPHRGQVFPGSPGLSRSMSSSAAAATPSSSRSTWPSSASTSPSCSSWSSSSAASPTPDPSQAPPSSSCRSSASTSPSSTRCCSYPSSRSTS